MALENVGDETIEQHLSNLGSGRLGDFVILQHGTPEGGGPYIQFTYVTRRRGPWGAQTRSGADSSRFAGRSNAHRRVPALGSAIQSVRVVKSNSGGRQRPTAH
jgi:hypothetical protein